MDLRSYTPTNFPLQAPRAQGNRVAGPPSGIQGLKQAASPVPAAQDDLDDDVIPTAIVIKNIPFSIKKEQLLDEMTRSGLPLPYAFNYHFDNGVFRGLAFANFTSTDETATVVSNLNGREIGGRKLRVEYKKMLPLVERERIEREKREKRGQLEEQHRSASTTSLVSMNSTKQDSMEPEKRFYANPAAGLAPAPPSTLDFNNPDVLEMYSTLLVFKQDSQRRHEEVAYPLVMSANHKKNLSILCQFLGLQEGYDGGMVIIKRRTIAGHNGAAVMNGGNAGVGNSGSTAPVGSNAGVAGSNNSNAAASMIHASRFRNTRAPATGYPPGGSQPAGLRGTRSFADVRATTLPINASIGSPTYNVSQPPTPGVEGNPKFNGSTNSGTSKSPYIHGNNSSSFLSQASPFGQQNQSLLNLNSGYFDNPSLNNNSNNNNNSNTNGGNSTFTPPSHGLYSNFNNSNPNFMSNNHSMLNLSQNLTGGDTFTTTLNTGNGFSNYDDLGSLASPIGISSSNNGTPISSTPTNSNMPGSTFNSNSSSGGMKSSATSIASNSPNMNSNSLGNSTTNSGKNLISSLNESLNGLNLNNAGQQNSRRDIWGNSRSTLL